MLKCVRKLVVFVNFLDVMLIDLSSYVSDVCMLLLLLMMYMIGVGDVIVGVLLNIGIGIVCVVWEVGGWYVVSVVCWGCVVYYNELKICCKFLYVLYECVIVVFFICGGMYLGRIFRCVGGNVILIVNCVNGWLYFCDVCLGYCW